MVEDRDRLARDDLPGEDIGRHVGAAPGAVDGEEAQTRQRNAVGDRIGVAHQLVGFLGRGVERDRIVHLVLDREGQLGVAAIDRGRTGVDHVAEPVAETSRGLKHVHVPNDVRLDVGTRILEAVADPRLGREVNDPVGPLHRVHHRREVGDVAAHEGEVLPRRKTCEARLLQTDVVIVVQVVDADHGLAPVEQGEAHMHAYETGRTGEKNGHGSRNSPSSRHARQLAPAQPFI